MIFYSFFEIFSFSHYIFCCQVKVNFKLWLQFPTDVDYGYIAITKETAALCLLLMGLSKGMLLKLMFTVRYRSQRRYFVDQ